jgi:hypothetical protein
MKVKELIKKIEALPSLTSITSIRPYVDKKIVLGLISQLDEPEKVTIPQFIADKIEYARKYDYTIFDAMMMTKRDDKFYDWVFADDNMETFTLAWKYGYEVEKEKRYLVKMKNIDTNSAYLKHQLQNNHWYWGSLTECGAFSPYHTKKELEADDFGWVFDCEVVEVEEVEG